MCAQGAASLFRVGHLPTILAFVDAHNEVPTAFVWTADLKDILPKIVRAHDALDKAQYQ